MTAPAVRGPKVAVRIWIHEETDDETGRESWIVSDDGAEYDDITHTSAVEVGHDLEERKAHYRGAGFEIVVMAPVGRGWS